MIRKILFFMSICTSFFFRTLSFSDCRRVDRRTSVVNLVITYRYLKKKKEKKKSNFVVLRELKRGKKGKSNDHLKYCSNISWVIKIARVQIKKTENKLDCDSSKFLERTWIKLENFSLQKILQNLNQNFVASIINCNHYVKIL